MSKGDQILVRLGTREARAIVAGIEKAVEDIVERLQEMKIEVKTKKDMENVASVASNNDREIGRIIAEAMDDLNLAYPAPSVNLEEIRRKYHAAVRLEKGGGKRV